jgi:hypothetical protein
MDDQGKLWTVEKGHGGDTAQGGLDVDGRLLHHGTYFTR